MKTPRNSTTEAKSIATGQERALPKHRTTQFISSVPLTLLFCTRSCGNPQALLHGRASGVGWTRQWCTSPCLSSRCASMLFTGVHDRLRTECAAVVRKVVRSWWTCTLSCFPSMQCCVMGALENVLFGQNGRCLNSSGSAKASSANGHSGEKTTTRSKRVRRRKTPSVHEVQKVLHQEFPLKRNRLDCKKGSCQAARVQEAKRAPSSARPKVGKAARPNGKGRRADLSRVIVATTGGAVKDFQVPLALKECAAS